MTRIYRVTEEEKEILVALRRKGEKCSQMIARLTAAIAELDSVPPKPIRAVSHRFDFERSELETIKAKAEELETTVIHLLIYTARQLVEKEKAGKL